MGIFADVGIDLVGVDVGDTSLELLKSINSLNDLQKSSPNNFSN